MKAEQEKSKFLLFVDRLVVAEMNQMFFSRKFNFMQMNQIISP
jgi:hypothetical protein